MILHRNDNYDVIVFLFFYLFFLDISFREMVKYGNMINYIFL